MRCVDCGKYRHVSFGADLIDRRASALKISDVIEVADEDVVPDKISRGDWHNRDAVRILIAVRRHSRPKGLDVVEVLDKRMVIAIPQRGQSEQEEKTRQCA